MCHSVAGILLSGRLPSMFFDNGRDMAHARPDTPGDPLSFMAIGYPAELFLASLISQVAMVRSDDAIEFP